MNTMFRVNACFVNSSATMFQRKQGEDAHVTDDGDGRSARRKTLAAFAQKRAPATEFRNVPRAREDMRFA